MAVVRHEEQSYATVAALVAETVAPKDNDNVYVVAIKRKFNWIPGSTSTHDGKFVIDQTSQTANGRWVAASASNVYTGTANSDALENGQESAVVVAVTGAAVGAAQLPTVTNGNTLPADVFVSACFISGANTVTVKVTNQSGAAVSAMAINVSVLEF